MEYLTRPIEILHVEDNELDADLMKRALDEIHFHKNVHHVEDGEAALEFLRRVGRFAESPRPDLILLDLNMPGIDGHDVLQQIKHDDDLKTIPVVILTTSSSLVDIKLAYGNYANGFVTKPFDHWDGTLDAIGALSQFWFSTVRLPPQPGATPLRQGEVPCQLSRECPIEILYVEDDPVDADAMVDVATSMGFTKPIHVVNFAEDAMDFLDREGVFKDAPTPDLVILDFNLPIRSGLDLLRAMRNNRPALRLLQTIMFTQADSVATILESYRSYVNAFIPKPETLDEWKHTLCAISHWYSVVKVA